MGRTYLFECSKCGYHARVAGGAAEGEHFAVQTIACADCRALHDAVTRFKALTAARENTPSSRAEIYRGVEPAAAARCAPMAEIQAGLPGFRLASHPPLETAG